MTDGGDPGRVAELSPAAARVRLVVLVVAVAGLAAVAVGAGPSAESIRSWVAGTGWAAPLLFVPLYAALVVVLVPGSVLTITAGLLFGGALGTLVTLVGATTGASIAFVVARTGGRPAVERLGSGAVARVDRWLGDRGLAAVITLRLVPLVPFSAANYAAGITAIRLRDFVAGTAVGIVPGTVAYNFLGARFTDPSDPVFLAAMAMLVSLAIGGSIALRRSRRARPATRTGPTDDTTERTSASSRS